MKKEITLDDLATMVQNGFGELRNELKSDLSAEIGRLEMKLNDIKSDTKEIRMELNKKVDKFEQKDLEYRVEKLEKKFA